MLDNLAPSQLGHVALDMSIANCIDTYVRVYGSRGPLHKGASAEGDPIFTPAPWLTIVSLRAAELADI